MRINQIKLCFTFRRSKGCVQHAAAEEASPPKYHLDFLLLANSSFVKLAILLSSSWKYYDSSKALRFFLYYRRMMNSKFKQNQA